MILDGFILIVGLLCFYLGFVKGMMNAFLWLMTGALSLVSALVFTPAMTQFLWDSTTVLPKAMPIIAFFLIFIISFLIFRLLGKLLGDRFSDKNVSFFNRFIGSLVFALMGVFLFSALLYFIAEISLISDQAKANSKLYGYVEDAPEKSVELFEVLFPWFSNLVDNFLNLFKDSPHQPLPK